MATTKKQRRSTGSTRARLGLPAKAGRRKAPAMESYRDTDGKRHWRAANGTVKA
jgi:hypothetical protein